MRSVSLFIFKGYKKLNKIKFYMCGPLSDKATKAFLISAGVFAIFGALGALG